MSSYLTVKNKVREIIVNAITPVQPPTTVTVTPTETEPNLTRGVTEEPEEPILTADKVFFATERATMPEYPYIMITELSNNEDLRSGRNNEPRNGVLEITQYKECIFTVAIYGISDTDLTTEHNTYRTELNNIRNAFELGSYRGSYKNAFTLQGMTDLRPLSNTNETGYLYRYEFDIRCGYNEEITQNVPLSEGVIIELEDNKIHEEIYKET